VPESVSTLSWQKIQAMTDVPYKQQSVAKIKHMFNYHLFLGEHMMAHSQHLTAHTQT
jgi:hypothetical protein